MSNVRITVGIPVHGSSHTLQAAVTQLIWSAAYANVEVDIHLVDDNSPEEEYAAICQLVAGWNMGLPHHVIGLTLHSVRSTTNRDNPNLGTILNTLRGIAKGNGYEYYLNLESDVVMHPNTLKDLLEEFDPTQHAGVFPMYITPDNTHADFLFYNLGIIPFEVVDEALTDSNRRELLTIRKVSWSNLGCFLTTTDHLLQTSIDDEESFDLWAADCAFTAKLTYNLRKPILFCPDVWVTHFGRASSKQGEENQVGSIEKGVNAFDEKWTFHHQGTFLWKY